jgi:hypothetical protein
MKIGNVLEKIDEKQLFVPAFQREYVWKRDDAKQLIDSLLKDYPTGTMLTWETSNPPELKGPHKYSTQQGSVKLLLDGQQRITTLYMLINGTIPPYYTEEDIIHPIMGLFVHLETLDLSYFMKTRMEGNPYWQNITEIFKRKIRPRDVVRAIEDQGVEVSRSLEDKIDDNTRAIENIVEREFPEQIIPPKASIKEAIDIFYKVNASGVALTEAELALAQISGYWPEARDAFKAKIRELSKQGFVFKLDFMVYAVLGCMYQLGSDMRRLHGEDNLLPLHDDQGNVIREGIMEVWEKLDKYVLDYVMNIMRSKAYVDHTSEINSVYALIPIITFCYLKHGQTIPEQQLWRIIKWFYYSQVRTRYVSQLPQKLDFDLRIVKNSEQPFEELLGVIAEERRLEITPDEFVGRSISHPLFGLMRWYIKSQGATCFTTGLGLHGNMGEKYQLENDHIFPSAILKNHGYGRENRVHYQYAQELTNRAILTSVANRKKSDDSALNYLTHIQTHSPEALKRQCIPSDPWLWQIENYEAFLGARRDLLAEEFNDFLVGLASENEGHYGKTTLLELIGEGESADLEFKQSLRWGSRERDKVEKAQSIIMKTIAGFANGDGGILLIGINDDGEAVGLEPDFESLDGDKDEFELYFGQILDREFGKLFRVNNLSISFPLIDEAHICQVEVRASQAPLVVTSKNKHGLKEEKFYLRTGNSTQELSMTETSDYITTRFGNT